MQYDSKMTGVEEVEKGVLSYLACARFSILLARGGGGLGVRGVMRVDVNRLPTMNVVGAGRLGRVLAALWVRAGCVALQGVCNRRLESAERAVAFVGAGQAYASLADLPPADVTLIASVDDAIASLALALRESPPLQAESLILHCSGVLTAEVLSPLKARGCQVASAHPAHSFADPALSLNTFAGTYVMIEGDQGAVNQLTRLFSAIEAIVVPILAHQKASYHAGLVFASNYLVTLFDVAQQSLAAAGIDASVSHGLISSLMRSACENVRQATSTVEALTGPISRYDVASIEAHLAGLSEASIRGLYCELGLHTVGLSDRTAAEKAVLHALFETALAQA